MTVVENFAAMSETEQRDFANALLKTINSEHIFSTETEFRPIDVEADDVTGGLVINVEHVNPIRVTRKATWYCDTEDDVADDPGFEADYVNHLYEDVATAFATLSTSIEGYKVSLEIADVDEGEAVEVNVDNYSQEDSGIGDYEYFGFTGHDSQPYVAVEGTIVRECDCALAFFVEPDDEITVETAEEEI